MKELKVFEFKSNQVRTTEIDGQIWFVARDVCVALSLTNASHACGRLDPDERGIINNDTLGGPQKVLTISESGLYSLALTSTKPEAKVFKKWITSEVLPSIRKTGSYAVPKLPTSPARVVDQQERMIKLLAPTLRAAKAWGKVIGLDRNQIAIKADFLLRQMTGCSPIKMLDSTTDLVDEKQEIYFIPSDLGRPFGLSPQAINKQLVEAGLQTKKFGKWVPTDEGKKYSKIFVAPKERSDGTVITQVKWSDKVIAMLKVKIAA